MSLPPLVTDDMPPRLADEVARRRTFAIIAHPDAGKTTLTEKLLLYGGAIHLAGAVRTRHRQRPTASDWMALERERGISITTSALQFPYRGRVLNLLDTPGHQDFSEDTYRTLVAADSAVMVLDAARGVEARTRKLFAVCRRRAIPVFTFVNKLDRAGREPLALLDEIERELGIDAVPMNWPIGAGGTFRGLYDRVGRRIHLFDRTEHGRRPARVEVVDLESAAVAELLGAHQQGQLRADVELLGTAGRVFDAAAVARGAQTPVFFGSALATFGVQLFLDAFAALAPAPAARRTRRGGLVRPDDEAFSGFVFKIQANLDPRHRDRVAFLRVCSGRCTRDTVATHQRTGRAVRLARPLRLFGAERQPMDEAYAGDVVGLVDAGGFAIGDTLSSADGVTLEAVPSFEPEHFAVLHNATPAKYKQFNAGLDQLAAEGAIQVLRGLDGTPRDPILAAVGPLQFDVVRFRLEAEYGVCTRVEALGYRRACRLDGRLADILALPWGRGTLLVRDGVGRPAGLFDADARLRDWDQRCPAVQFLGWSAPGAPA